MHCRLCQQSKPLLRSHIIPEFMHKTMYDSAHRFFGLSGNVSRKVKIHQKGMREPLLCRDCEQQFGRYEKYANGIFFGGQTYEIGRSENLILLSKLEYGPLKLFLMSLLWRMAVTSVDALKGIELGAHEENLRQLLLNENPGDPMTYPCLITAVMHEGVHVPDMIVRPGLGEIEGHRVWSFVAAGFLFSFVASRNGSPEGMDRAVLRPDGTMSIVVRELRSIPGLHDYLCEIGQAHRERMAQRESAENP